MNEFSRRLLRRSLAVAVALGVIGYIFAEVFLMLHRMNGGVAESSNNSVRWRTPLNMAAIGVVLQIVVETIMFAIRGKKLPPTARTLEAPNFPIKQSGSSAV